MVPEFRRRVFFVALVNAESLETEDEPANDFDADELDGFGRAGDLPGDAELSGVDDLKELGGDAQVLLDDGGDVIEGGVGRI